MVSSSAPGPYVKDGGGGVRWECSHHKEREKWGVTWWQPPAGQDTKWRGRWESLVAILHKTVYPTILQGESIILGWFRKIIKNINPIRKCIKGMTYLIEEDIDMINKHMKKCSTSLSH